RLRAGRPQTVPRSRSQARGPCMSSSAHTPLAEEATSPYFTAEHEMLRRTVRRFVAERVRPQGEAWEEQGFVPREILREMGDLGLLGIRYAQRHGGSELDTLATVVLAEE